MSTHSSTEVNAEDIIKAMLNKEQLYLCRPNANAGKLSPTSVLKHHSMSIHESWRERSCEWMYKVRPSLTIIDYRSAQLLIEETVYTYLCMKIVDFYSLDRETIAISCSLFDRFVSKTSPTESREFQLIALTTLYIAVKLNERKTSNTLESFVRLGKKEFSKNEIMVMETKILFTLEWLVHPPTPQAFTNQFLELLPAGTFTQSQKRVFFELVVYIIEITILQAEFIPEKSSTMALTSILLAMSNIDTTRMSHEEQKKFLSSIMDLTRISSKEVTLLCKKFQLILQDANINLSQVSGILDPDSLLYDTEEEYHTITYTTSSVVNRPRPITPS